MSKIFKIPVSWEVFGIVRVEAETLDEAIKKFDETEQSGHGYPLPEGEYIDGSFKREDEETCTINNLNSF